MAHQHVIIPSKDNVIVSSDEYQASMRVLDAVRDLLDQIREDHPGEEFFKRTIKELDWRLEEYERIERSS